MNKPCCPLRKKFNERASVCDIILIVFSLITLGVMLSSLFPSFIECSPLTLFVVAVIFALKPLITLLKK